MSRTPQVKKNKCPVCQKPIPDDFIFCSTHWFRVPQALRDRIWHLFRAEPGSTAHRQAVLEAVAGVQASLKGRVP